MAKQQQGTTRILMVVLVLLVAQIFSSEKVNAAGGAQTKQYQGPNYTITYPASGFDTQLPDLIKEVDQIIPFVEAYGTIKFDHLQLNVVSSKSQLGQYAGNSSIEKLTITIPAEYYHMEVVFHEFCHLAQYHLNLPAWFAESHAETCVQKFYESMRDAADAKQMDDFYQERQNTYKNVKPRIPEDIPKVSNLSENVQIINAANEFFMMKELINTASMAKILPKLREDFGVDKSNRPDRFKIISNDEIICDINSVTSKDVFSIFKKYGFKIPDCSSKPKPAPEPEPASPTTPANKTNSTGQLPVGLFIMVTGILGIFFLLLIIFGIIKLIKYIFTRFIKKGKGTS